MKKQTVEQLALKTLNEASKFMQDGNSVAADFLHTRAAILATLAVAHSIGSLEEMLRRSWSRDRS